VGCTRNIARTPTPKEPVYAAVIIERHYSHTFLFCSQQCHREYWPSKREMARMKREAIEEAADAR
jgi:hypothetical protein